MKRQGDAPPTVGAPSGLSRYPMRTASAAPGHVQTRTRPAPTAWRPLMAGQRQV
jgi:hypothetical protein